MMPTQSVEAPPRGWRFRIGVGLLVLGLICPFLILLVTASSLSTEWKTLISGLLLVGGPEIITFVAVVFLGKEGFNCVKSRLIAFFKYTARHTRLSRTGYRTDLPYQRECIVID